MVHASVSVSVEAEQHQTALRGLAPVPIRDGDCHPPGVAPQKPLRADGPVKQSGVLDPRRVTASARQPPWESRPTRGRGDWRSPRRRQLGCTRPSGRIGWAMAQHRSHVNTGRRGGGQSRLGRGRAFAAARRVRGRAPDDASAKRGRPWCPSSAYSSPPRAGGRKINPSDPVHVSALFAGGLGRRSTHPFRNRFTSNGTCLRHRW
jgi:hypothetical protein